MERLQSDKKRHLVTLDLREIFNDDDLQLEQLDTSDIPDNILSDILDSTINSEEQKSNKSEGEHESIRLDRSRSKSDVYAIVKKNQNRFKVITHKDVDEIAGKSVKKRTHKQTEWGIKVFRGNFLQLFYQLNNSDVRKFKI